MNEKIKIGIEIECSFNSSIHKIEKGGYHSGMNISNLPFWTAENDSSLRRGDAFNGWDTTGEFVSGVFNGKKELKSGLEAFKKYFSKNNKYELKEVLNFNDSMGSHCHFSINNFIFNEKVIFKEFFKVRKYFFNKIKKSNIQSKDLILKQYYRHYSQEMTEINWKHHLRYNEFNFNSEEERKGLEWRSLNMIEIKTWKEFFEFWNIVYDSIKYFIRISTDYSEISIKKMIDLSYIKDLKLEKEKERKQMVYIRHKKTKRTYSRIKPKINYFLGGEVQCAI